MPFEGPVDTFATRAEPEEVDPLASSGLQVTCALESSAGQSLTSLLKLPFRTRFCAATGSAASTKAAAAAKRRKRRSSLTISILRSLYSQSSRGVTTNGSGWWGLCLAYEN
jgi:hypothetical protein